MSSSYLYRNVISPDLNPNEFPFLQGNILVENSVLFSILNFVVFCCYVYFRIVYLMFLQRRLFVCVMCFMSFFFPAFPSASGGRQMGDGR